MAQHVRVSLDFEPCRLGNLFQQSGKARCRERRPALRDKHECGCLGFPLDLPKGAYLETGNASQACPAVSTDVQDGPIEVHLIPKRRVAEFRCA